MMFSAAACLVIVSALATTTAPSSPPTLDAVNAAFVEHAAQAAPRDVAMMLELTWRERGADFDAAAFIPNALSAMNDAFQEARAAFVGGDMERAAARFEPLMQAADPYLAANAAALRMAALAQLQQWARFDAALADASTEVLEQHTPIAAEIALLSVFSSIRGSRMSEAARRATGLLERYADAPESVRLAAQQLLQQLESGGLAKLDAAREHMLSASGGLIESRAGDQVQAAQERAIALLDELIEQAQQQENQQRQQQQQQQQASASASGAASGAPAGASTERTGAGEIGELRAPAPILPGESWGELPPAEREAILQDLRERAPARYRTLVEQYYRALAEEE